QRPKYIFEECWIHSILGTSECKKSRGKRREWHTQTSKIQNVRLFFKIDLVRNLIKSCLSSYSCKVIYYEENLYRLNYFSTKSFTVLFCNFILIDFTKENIVSFTNKKFSIYHFL